ncbi:MAG: OmpA family protein [Rhodospirillaceae bacterium]
MESKFKLPMTGSGIVFGAALLLAGCSSVPDAANPVEWYKSVKESISGDDTEKADDAGEKPANELVADRDKPAPGANEEFPKLSSVPQRPATSSAAERERIREGLVADQESARRYSDEVIQRQGEASNPLPPSSPAPAPQTAVKPPEPAPMPAPKPEPIKQEMAKTPAAQPMPAPPQVTPPPPPQSTGSEQQSNFKEPAVQMAAISPAPAGQQGTVVISGSGVQTVESAAAIQGNAPAVSGTSLPGVRSLSEFNPNGVRGSYQVATIIFAKGSSKLAARDRRILRQVVGQHKKVGGTIRVVGHASHRTRNLEPVRHKMVNFEVSSERADIVAKELVKLGTPAGSLFVGAASDNEPKYREYMPAGEAGNRRADIFIDF